MEKQFVKDVFNKLESWEEKINKIDSIEHQIKSLRSEISIQILDVKNSLRSEISSHTNTVLDTKRDYVTSIGKLTNIEEIVNRHDDTLANLNTKIGSCYYCRTRDIGIKYPPNIYG